jgi:hypothetical protein
MIRDVDWDSGGLEEAGLGKVASCSIFGKPRTIDKCGDIGATVALGDLDPKLDSL